MGVKVSNVASFKRCELFIEKFKELSEVMDKMTTADCVVLMSVFEEAQAKEKRKDICYEEV